jgi:hypothetical protein
MEKLEKLEKAEKIEECKQIDTEITPEGAPTTQDKEPEDQEETPPNPFRYDDQFRYFKDNIICFKCNKVGHYKAVCPENTVCIYCFSPSHDTENCPQKNVCFRCYGFGHIFVHCKAK